MKKIDNKKEDMRGKVLKAADLVAYDKGAVVSRIIIEKENCSVSVFSFDKGQGLTEHTSPFDAMVQVLDGEAEITISGKPRKVNAGEFIILPANKPHALKAVEKFKMALVMLRS